MSRTDEQIEDDHDFTYQIQRDGSYQCTSFWGGWKSIMICCESFGDGNNISRAAGQNRENKQSRGLRDHGQSIMEELEHPPVNQIVECYGSE